MIKVEKKKVDSHGRISIPISWRQRVLGKSRDVLLVELEDRVEVLSKDADLEKYIDSVEIVAEEFENYHALRKEIRKVVK